MSKDKNLFYSQNGFTLIEIALVLLSIGFLSAGILGGEELIKAAKIRNTIQQFEQYNTAVNTFQTKYNNLPGDIPSAEMSGLSGGLADTGGNGDGIVGICPHDTLDPCSYHNDPAAPNYDPVLQHRVNMEHYNFWYHLSLAGLIKETIAPSDSVDPATGLERDRYYMVLGNRELPLGGGTPEASVKVDRRSWVDSTSKGGWGVEYNVRFHQWPPVTDKEFSGHSLILGNIQSAGHYYTDGYMGTFPTPGGFLPFILWSMDAKMDDGLPFEGKVIMWQGIERKVEPWGVFHLTGWADPPGSQPECHILEGGELHYNVQHQGGTYDPQWLELYGLCSLAFKAAF